MCFGIQHQMSRGMKIIPLERNFWIRYEDWFCTNTHESQRVIQYLALLFSSIFLIGRRLLYTSSTIWYHCPMPLLIVVVLWNNHQAQVQILVLVVFISQICWSAISFTTSHLKNLILLVLCEPEPPELLGRRMLLAAPRGSTSLQGVVVEAWPVLLVVVVVVVIVAHNLLPLQ